MAWWNTPSVGRHRCRTRSRAATDRRPAGCANGHRRTLSGPPPGWPRPRGRGALPECARGSDPQASERSGRRVIRRGHRWRETCLTPKAGDDAEVCQLLRASLMVGRLTPSFSASSGSDAVGRPSSVPPDRSFQPRRRVPRHRAFASPPGATIVQPPDWLDGQNLARVGRKCLVSDRS